MGLQGSVHAAMGPSANSLLVRRSLPILLGKVTEGGTNLSSYSKMTASIFLDTAATLYQ